MSKLTTLGNLEKFRNEGEANNLSLVKKKLSENEEMVFANALQGEEKTAGNNILKLKAGTYSCNDDSGVGELVINENGTCNVKVTSGSPFFVVRIDEIASEATITCAVNYTAEDSTAFFQFCSDSSDPVNTLFGPKASFESGSDNAYGTLEQAAKYIYIVVSAANFFVPYILSGEFEEKQTLISGVVNYDRVNNQKAEVIISQEAGNSIIHAVAGTYTCNTEGKVGTLVVDESGEMTATITSSDPFFVIPLKKKIASGTSITTAMSWTGGNYNNFFQFCYDPSSPRTSNFGTAVYCIDSGWKSWTLSRDAEYLFVRCASSLTFTPYALEGAYSSKPALIKRNTGEVVLSVNGVEQTHTLAAGERKIVQVDLSGDDGTIVARKSDAHDYPSDVSCAYCLDPQEKIIRLKKMRLSVFLKGYNVRYPQLTAYDIGWSGQITDIKEGDTLYVTCASENGALSPGVIAVNEKGVAFKSWCKDSGVNVSYRNYKITVPKGAAKIVVNVRNRLDESDRYNGGINRVSVFKEINESELESGSVGVFFGDSVAEGFGALPVTNSFGNVNMLPTLDGVSACARHMMAEIHNGGIGSSSFITGGGMNTVCHAVASGDYTEIDNAIEHMITQNVALTNMRGQWAKIKKLDFSDVDFVCFAYGTNDWAYAETLDSIETAIEGAIQELLTAYPKLKVYFFTPTIRRNGSTSVYSDDDSWTNSIGLTLGAYCEKIMEVCKKLHIPCKDMYNESGINRYNFNSLFNDYVHPNENGYELIGKEWAKFILSN